MKKIAVSVVVAVFFISYIIYQRSLTSGSTNQSALDAVNSTPTSQTVDNSNSTTALPVESNPRGATPTPTPAGQFKNGTYTGSVADASYGNIQVRATISGGKLTGIEFLQFPNDRGHSVEINQYALPILRSEAISNQSAQVDTVSGATDSSAAFRESLQSALSQAA